MTAEVVESAAEFVPVVPKLQHHGFPVAPYFYPKLMRRVADLLDALNAISDEDGARIESPHFTSLPTPIAIYDDERYRDEDPPGGLEGWVMSIDLNCYVFVPYVPEIESVTSPEPVTP